MNHELRRAQLLRKFNDAEHKPKEIAGREIIISITDGLPARSRVELHFMRFPGAIHGFTVFPGPLRAQGQQFLFRFMAEKLRFTN